MASSNQCLIAFSILLLGARSGQSNQGGSTADAPQSKTEGYSVQADVKLSDGGQTQTDLGLVAVDDTGAFQMPIPECSNDRLAHRELRCALKNEAGQTLALLLPKMTANGFYQSRFGVWLPVKAVLPGLQNEAVFA